MIVTCYIQYHFQSLCFLVIKYFCYQDEKAVKDINWSWKTVSTFQAMTLIYSLTNKIAKYDPAVAVAMSEWLHGYSSGVK
ncbi:hypothetical protein BpHYR1_040646 [Brachionus plicatilis]|uniref:Uncharacterized protein n=1 Tax=Brachionus plicatilis TaxID=10195 RepID=A0A3M7QHP1_BRAPC|nr:hypothetical protein BpHYR1_040646 [Brachionus plicatilis]